MVPAIKEVEVDFCDTSEWETVEIDCDGKRKFRFEGDFISNIEVVPKCGKLLKVQLSYNDVIIETLQGSGEFCLFKNKPLFARAECYGTFCIDTFDTEAIIRYKRLITNDFNNVVNNDTVIILWVPTKVMSEKCESVYGVLQGGSLKKYTTKWIMNGILEYEYEPNNLVTRYR
jgi:hypothetical protein